MYSLKGFRPSNMYSKSNLSLEDQALLRWAVRNRMRETILRILRLNVNWKASFKNGDTLLHLALHKPCTFDGQNSVISILEIFLERGVDVNAKNDEGKTVLYLAIKSRLKHVIDFLLKNGADMNIRDDDGNSIAHFLICTEFDRFSKFCYVCDKPYERNVYGLKGKSFLDWMLFKGMNVNCENNFGITPLRSALNLNLQHVIPSLLDSTKNVYIIDDKKRNILHVFLESLVAFNNPGLKNINRATSIPTFCYDERYIKQIIKILLHRGVSVDAVDKYGNTPLHLVAKQEKSKVIKLLLESFTNVNAADDRGNTVLHIIIDTCIDDCSKHKPEYVELVKILLSKGANVHLENEDGIVPVQLAALRKNITILQILKEHGVNFNVIHDDGNLLNFGTKIKLETPDSNIIKELIDYLIDIMHCDVNFKNKQGTTPLHLALQSGDLISLEKLVERGANVHSRMLTQHRYSPLHLAVINNQDQCVEILVKAGADINVKDSFGRTPLHLAVRYGGNMANLLLRLGAHVDLQDDDRQTAMHLAVRYENFDGVKELLMFGADINDVGTLRELENLIFSKTMIKCLLQQWYKLKTIRLPVSDDYMLYIDKYENFEYQKRCNEEVEILKTHFVGKNLSLYDFLHMDLNNQCAFAKDFEDLLDPLILQDQYPEYADVILAACHQAVERQPLIWPSIRAWYNLTDVYLPEFCVERIVAYLDNANLRVMIEGAKECSVRRSISSS